MMRKFFSVSVGLFLLMLMLGCACAEGFRLPDSIQTIESMAFYQGVHTDTLEIPEGCVTIGSKAFAGCEFSCVILPESLVFIEGDAFQDAGSFDVIAPAGSYACWWANNKGYNVCANPSEDFSFADNGDGTCTLTKYSGADDVVVVPDHDPEGRPVTVIGDKAFSYKATLNNDAPIQRIYLPSTVTNIGYYAFGNRTNLNYIRLPKGLQTIGELAFVYCGLTSIDLPVGLKRIGKSAFLGSKLTSVDLPEGVQIEEEAFKGTPLTSIRIPAGIDSIGNAAFSNCNELKELTFDGDVVSIGDNAFYLTAIESLRLPDTLRQIGNSAFYNCYQLTEIELPDSLISIGKEAFSSSKISGITIPVNVNYIGNSAFSNCRNLKNVVWNCASLSEISDNLFSSCFSLEEISLPNGITSIGRCAFMGCENLQSIHIPDSVTSIGDFAFSCGIRTVFGENPWDQWFYCIPLSRLRQIRLPANLTEIGKGAFQHCDALPEIGLPPTLASIGEGAFSACNGLEKLVIPGGIGCLDRVFNGVNSGKLGMHSNNLATSLKEIVISEGVTAIADKAFKGLAGLEKVTIPFSVVEIGETTFEGCEAVTVYCETGSYAARFCAEHGIPCVLSSGSTFEEMLSKSVKAIVSEYVDDDGFMPNDESMLENAAQAVYEYAIQLKEQGLISDCTYCREGHSVAFYDHRNWVYLYMPVIRETCSGSRDYSAIGISGFSWLQSTVIDGVDALSQFKVTGSLEAAKYIHTNAGEYIQDVPYSGNNATVSDIAQGLRLISPARYPQGRVIFWRGHGGLWTDQRGITHTVLAVNEKEDGDKYAAYRDSHAVIVSDGRYFVTDRFFEEELPETNGGLFVCGSCYGTCDDGRLAKTILSKGFSAFVGTNGSVWGPYSEKFLGQLAVHLVERDDNGLYITLDEAVRRTKSDLNATDIYGYSFNIVSHQGAQPFRLAQTAKVLSDYPVLQYNGHSYQYVPQPATFDDAERMCEAVGGHLCTMGTEEENEEVTRYLARNGIGGAMIGLYDANGSNGTWDTWVTGEPVTFSAWAYNQPDWTGQTVCVLGTTYGYYGTYDYGKWDNNWNGNISFICEWDNGFESDDMTSIDNLSISREAERVDVPHTATFTSTGDIQGVRITMIRASGETVDLGEYTLRNGGASRSEISGGYSWTVTFTPTEGGEADDNYMVRFQVRGIDSQGIDTIRYARSCSMRLLKNMYYYNGHTYQYVDADKTWSYASVWCRAQGGHLLTINSESEQEMITSWLMSNYNFKRVWIGLNRSDFNTWITGEPVTYSNWGPTQPDNDWNTPQNCVAIANYYQSGKLSPGQWDDWGQENVDKEFFVCEWEEAIQNMNADAIMFTYAEGSDSEAVFGKPGLEYSYDCLYGNEEREVALNDVLRSYGYSETSLAETEKLIVFVEGYGKDLTFEKGKEISKQTALCAVLWRGKVVYATTQASTLPDWPFSSDGNYDSSGCSDVNTLPDGIYENVTETHHRPRDLNYPALKFGGENGVMAIRVHSPSTKSHAKADCPLENGNHCQAAAMLNKGINIHKTGRSINKGEKVTPGSAGCLNIHQDVYDAFAAAAGFALLRVNSGLALAKTGTNDGIKTCRPVVIVSRKYGYEHIDDFRTYMDRKYTAPDESSPRVNLINAILDGDSDYEGNG